MNPRKYLLRTLTHTTGTQCNARLLTTQTKTTDQTIRPPSIKPLLKTFPIPKHSCEGYNKQLDTSHSNRSFHEIFFSSLLCFVSSSRGYPPRNSTGPAPPACDGCCQRQWHNHLAH